VHDVVLRVARFGLGAITTPAKLFALTARLPEASCACTMCRRTSAETGQAFNDLNIKSVAIDFVDGTQ
jgi:hypothetical protein